MKCSLSLFHRRLFGIQEHTFRSIYCNNIILLMKGCRRFNSIQLTFYNNLIVKRSITDRLTFIQGANRILAMRQRLVDITRESRQITVYVHENCWTQTQPLRLIERLSYMKNIGDSTVHTVGDSMYEEHTSSLQCAIHITLCSGKGCIIWFNMRFIAITVHTHMQHIANIIYSFIVCYIFPITHPSNGLHVQCRAHLRLYIARSLFICE